MTYEYNSVRYQRTAFASHPDGVIVVHLAADKQAACTGRIQLAEPETFALLAEIWGSLPGSAPRSKQN